MLTHLSVRNVVLIDRLDLDFGPGLTVLTGETGAGKSILLDALSLALGMRADSGLVRSGQKEAAVTAAFTFPPTHPIADILAEHGYDFDGDLIVRRTLSSDGRSRAFINDMPVSVAFLRELGDRIVEIHGQFASHRLLNPATHLDTLDAYGRLTTLKDSVRHAYELWHFHRLERDRAEQELLLAQKEEVFLRESVQDLDRLNPEPDEEERLVARRTALMNAEKILTALGTTVGLLSDEESGAVSVLNRALAELEHADTWSGGSLTDSTARLSEALSLIEDVRSSVEQAGERFGDIAELPAIDDRLFALRDMARKHQVSIAELASLRDRLSDQLHRLECGAEALAELKQREATARQEYIDRATELSHARRQAANRLDASLAQELPALKLGKATFQTDLKSLDEADWSETGRDSALFLVSTNAGTPPAPIHKVVSGGELARFMLALKVNLATAMESETLVFDEVDTGIGGATASAVGARLKKLAQTCQVLTVTHSPQVAAYGDTHLTVQKAETAGTVTTTVTSLDPDSRLQEVARMLSGETITSTAHTMARELLTAAASFQA